MNKHLESSGCKTESECNGSVKMAKSEKPVSKSVPSDVTKVKDPFVHPMPGSVSILNSDIKTEVSQDVVKHFTRRVQCPHRFKETWSEMGQKRLALRPPTGSAAPQPKSKKPRKTLSSREIRQHKVFEIDPKHQRYENYLPLHDLWKCYIDELLNLDKLKSSNMTEVERKMIRADYHGSIITVTKSSCPSLVGLSGIVLQETKNTFKVITKENVLKTLPKAHAWFTVDLGSHSLVIYGSNFCHRPATRSARSFKAQASIDV